MFIDDEPSIPTPNLDAMPDRDECLKMIDQVARCGDVADLTFMLQVVCLELLDLRARCDDTYFILKGSGLGYMKHHSYDGVMYGNEGWEDDAVKSRRPAA